MKHFVIFAAVMFLLSSFVSPSANKIVECVKIDHDCHNHDTHYSRSSKSRFHEFKKHSMIISTKHKDSKKRNTAAINPVTKKPYVIWFVNNQSNSGGNGTFESPFNTLVDAQTISQPNDIIYVFPGNETDDGMNAGIVLKNGQQLLGAGIKQEIETTKGLIHVPKQARGLPVISNTLTTSAENRFNAVLMDQGDNVVSGLHLVDNIGGGFLLDGSDTSGGMAIADGLNYLIKNNISSSFDNPQTNSPGGNGLNLFGGGNVTVKKNTFVGRDTGDTYGINGTVTIAPVQGLFVFENNLFTGADENSGLDLGIVVVPNAAFVIGNLSYSMVGNTFNSQTNIARDGPGGIDVNVAPNALNHITVNIKDNHVDLPASIEGLVAGIRIVAHGPGPVNARVHKNVSITPSGVPGFLFRTFGNPGNLNLDLGFDNIGTVEIIP